MSTSQEIDKRDGGNYSYSLDQVKELLNIVQRRQFNISCGNIVSEQFSESSFQAKQMFKSSTEIHNDSRPNKRPKIDDNYKDKRSDKFNLLDKCFELQRALEEYKQHYPVLATEFEKRKMEEDLKPHFCL